MQRIDLSGKAALVTGGTVRRAGDQMRHSAAVLDTNVFVAAGFKPGSASARIRDAVQHGRLRILWDDTTRAEIEFILRRIPPLRDFAVSDLFRLEDRFAGTTDPAAFADIPDPDDRKFAALAHAAGVPLVTSDAHLLRPQHADLDVLTPGAFWRRFERTVEEAGAGQG
jgi:predicted nucleic acid-binding protein